MPTTAAPTTADAVTIEVAMSLKATEPFHNEQKDDLELAIASQLGVEKAAIENLEVTSTVSQERRALLDAGYTWSVEFDVVTALALTQHSTTNEYSAKIANLLSTGSFESTVETYLGAVGVSVEEVLARVITTTDDTDGSSDNRNEDDLEVALLIALTVGTGVVGLALVVGLTVRDPLCLAKRTQAVYRVGTPIAPQSTDWTAEGAEDPLQITPRAAAPARARLHAVDLEAMAADQGEGARGELREASALAHRTNVDGADTKTATYDVVTIERKGGGIVATAYHATPGNVNVLL